ncbi:hydroxyproline dehydrogenase isoform X1, partial [Gallus gallus]|uniref:hydroxyproline dehydrogenase isoform X1 n=1 Tax=Gallus gallus TaxID=9031 RepID=UPI001AE889F8
TPPSPPPPPPPLDLEAQSAFSHCSPTELLRAAVVLRLCAAPLLVRHSHTLLELSRRAVGRRVWGALLRRTLYAHFVGGDSAPLWAEAVRRLRAVGISPMLALPMEHLGAAPGESWFEENRGAALQGVGLAASSGPGAMMQLKVTAMMEAELCQEVSQRLEEPQSEFSVEKVMAVMGGQLPHSDLPSPPQTPSFSCLSPEQNQALGAGLRRLDHVAAAAVGSGVGLLLDAEQSELGPALRLWAMGLMGRHNRGVTHIWHTHQAYLQGAEERLLSDLQSARRMGAPYGLKLVRGAYLHHERRTGALQPSREHTDRSYAACLELALQHVTAGHVALVVATHNAGSVRHAARRMEELRIPRDGPVCFAQLQGVAEHLGLALGRAGFRALRSVPYGPPEAVLPYLARRAQEHPELPGSAQQRAALRAELRRRLLPWGGS